MANQQNDRVTVRKPLRVWPGVVLLILILLANYGLPVVYPEWGIYGMMGALAAGLGILLWWLFFSRAPWGERLGALPLMALGIFAMLRLADRSIITGAMGFLPYILVIPTLSIAFVLWAVITRNRSTGVRWISLIAAILIGCGVWAVVRTGGFTADGDHDFAWRWSESSEERLLASQPVIKKAEPQSTPSQQTEAPDKPVQSKPVEEPAPSSEEPESAQQMEASQTAAIPPVEQGTEAEWPGFRGAQRDSIVRGVSIQTDWSTSPPVELWRRKIGPGWSSFAVQGDLIYTQEQRGEEEVVSCYSKKTGEPVWMHTDPVRFWESNAGPGPRGTPTLHQGRVYAFGATGVLNVLHANNGSMVWSRNAAEDTGAKLPGWGFSSSPLIVDDAVIVATSGQLAAYDLGTGQIRWKGPEGGTDYSSPHLVMINGIPQILLMNRPGTISLAPASGKLLWQHPLPAATRIVQPAVITDGELLLSEGDQRGTRRVSVSNGSGGWNVKEQWTSNGLKPYFNDFVVHDGHAYGFDGSYISCIDLNDGKRKWKGGRYGHGQLILLADQNLLLILSEKGELALARAVPGEFAEVARFKAIEGKTWNHPVLTGDILLVRNGEEMAAFRLSLLGAKAQGH
jgi:outer membrane protein assembly factor BamB